MSHASEEGTEVIAPRSSFSTAAAARPQWRTHLARWPKALVLGIQLTEADVQDLLSEARDERFVRFLGGVTKAAGSITPLFRELPAELLLRLLQIHWAVEKELRDFIEPAVDVDPRVRTLLYMSALGLRALQNTGTPLDRVR